MRLVPCASIIVGSLLASRHAGRAAAITGCVALVLASMRVHAAPSSEPHVEPAADVLRVEVERGIDDASLLPGWIAERHPSLREALRVPEGARAQWIAVTIVGSTYDYRVAVVAVRDGEPLGPAREPTRCECTTEELLARVDAGIEAAVERLRAPAPSEPMPRVASPATASAPLPEPRRDGPSPARGRPDTRARHLGPLGQTGVGVTVAGAGLVTAGIVLVARPKQIRGQPGDVEIRDLRGGGLGLAVTGGVVLATGVALVVADRVGARPRATAWAPVLRPGMVGISIARRF